MLLYPGPPGPGDPYQGQPQAWAHVPLPPGYGPSGPGAVPPPQVPARTQHSRRPLIILVAGAVLLGALSVGRAVILYRVNASIKVTGEPVASSVNPFTPAGFVGTDEPNVQPPPRSGGVFSAVTAGLYGGT